MTSNLIVRLAPVIFVVLWSTGYIGAKFGTADAEPFTFLAIRFFITVVILLLVTMLFVRPRQFFSVEFLHSVIAGCLLHGIYLGGIFYAIDRGMPAGVSALVVSLQPFFTAVVAWVILREQFPPKRGVFFIIALAGVFLVLFPKIDFSQAIPGITAETLIAAFIGTVAISIGAVYQKRYVTNLNLWVSTAGQFIGAVAVVAIGSLLFETREISWTPSLFFSLAWLIFVLSIGAVALLMYLIRKGDTSSVASLFFLVPVVAMFMAWVLFDETVSLVQVFGSLLVVVSVAVSSRIENMHPK